MSETIAIGSDHAGLELKQILVAELQALGFVVKDFGTNSTDSVDYPDFAFPVAKAVNDGTYKRGIVVCGSGQGVAMAANKLPNIRAALCRSEWDARVSRQHNDANILALGGRVSTPEEGKDMLRVFLNTEFEGGRHAARVDKLSKGCC